MVQTWDLDGGGVVVTYGQRQRGAFPSVYGGVAVVMAVWETEMYLICGGRPVEQKDRAAMREVAFAPLGKFDTFRGASLN